MQQYWQIRPRIQHREWKGWSVSQLTFLRLTFILEHTGACSTTHNFQGMYTSYYIHTLIIMTVNMWSASTLLWGKHFSRRIPCSVVTIIMLWSWRLWYCNFFYYKNTVTWSNEKSDQTDGIEITIQSSRTLGTKSISCHWDFVRWPVEGHDFYGFPD